MKKYIKRIKNKFFNITIKNKYFKKFLIITGLASCMGAAGIAGFAIHGEIGTSFGIILGYVIGKLLII